MIITEAAKIRNLEKRNNELFEMVEDVKKENERLVIRADELRGVIMDRNFNVDPSLGKPVAYVKYKDDLRDILDYLGCASAESAIEKIKKIEKE